MTTILPKSTTISGQIIDIYNRQICKGLVTIENGKITQIEKTTNEVASQYILPGFIDAHIHIESSMLTPLAFGSAACAHGTVATISDPHEIANVCGIDGIKFMIENAKLSPIKIFFGAPSCVPATSYETAGATIDSADIDKLMSSDDIWYLSEMMNYPGVLNNDPEILNKLSSASKHLKPIDGHSPGLKGQLAKEYIEHGISTDHECFTLEEALDKLKYGMKIIIREGSAAKNFEALHPIIATHADKVMFCSDDKHPDDLIEGHINTLVKRALHLGYNLFDILTIACINPIEHYKIPVGSLRVGEAADFIIINNLIDFDVLETFIDGKSVVANFSQNGLSQSDKRINQFNISKCNPQLLKSFIFKNQESITPVIDAIDGSLITEKSLLKPKMKNGEFLPNCDEDILKICVVNRYQDAKPAIGFIHNFGFQNLAIASTVAHDSHNIIAIGDDDEKMAKCINLLIECKGGLAAVSAESRLCLPLPIGGLMSDLSCLEIGNLYKEISNFVKSHGSKLHSPYMTMSFMALLVIPKIKISDLGMFDAENFTFYK